MIDLNPISNKEISNTYYLSEAITPYEWALKT